MTGPPGHKTGKIGETLAEKFLIKRRFSILGRNVPTPFGEIDLVTIQDNCIVFVEVKTRISERFGDALSAITPSKRRHIIKNSLYYVKRHGLYEKPWRIDIIGIKLNTRHGLEWLKHVKNAVTAEGG